MKHTLLIALFTLVSCGPTIPTPKPNYEVKLKFCMQECIKDKFKMFHNKGESWGTNSSSMNGLQDTGLLNKVETQCIDFLKGEKCCKYSHNGNNHIDYMFSGYNYGICK